MKMMRLTLSSAGIGLGVSNMSTTRHIESLILVASVLAGSTILRGLRKTHALLLN